MKTVLAPNAPWPYNKVEEVAEPPKPKPKPKKVPHKSKIKRTTERFNQWAEKNL